jgi:Ni/Fe-hydrogenase subunit HybB-like protein
MATVSATAPSGRTARSIGMTESAGLLLLVLIGAWAWWSQLTKGMGVLGTGQAVVWGAYIAAFFLLVGIGCGLMVLAALGDLGVAGLQDMRREYLLASLASLVAAGFAILMDIGHPERVLGFLSSANFSSPFVWDFYGLALAVVVGLVYLLVGGPGKLLPWIAVLVSMLVVLAEGWILGVSAARPSWHGGTLPVAFLIEGMVAACAVGLLMHGEKKQLRQALLLLLPVLLIVSLSEALALTYGTGTEAGAAMGMLVNGSLSPLFWLGLLFGVALPFAWLAWSGDSAVALGLSGVLPIAGVYMLKLGVLVSGQALPFMQPEASYVPSGVEIAGVAGILALAALLFQIGRAALPSKS